ncbi:MAG: UDP-N-acetylmuramoyl-L-alanine--D-glutamate ligase [Cyanobacteria bacterium K_Offshore_surface_m2_239]|nr:UDP-N-acetylmuramoyl-L-alanine--D-glutamate ligase [Cyanobacteria bacterium K_Offshore_surface_m2_239]
MILPAANAHRTAVVVGLGRSGKGAARLLRALNWSVIVIESRSGEALEAEAADLRAEGIAVRLNAPLRLETFANLPSADAVIVSPGIAWDQPVLVALRERGVRVQGEISPAWQATADAAIPWIGITGTNGKTTVTHLIHHLLCAAGLDAPLCGNVGFSAAELALQCQRDGRRPDWLVVELSSYQIEASPEIAPRIGVWTTLTPDHLERHGTLERYRGIKRGLLEASGTRILNADDPDLRARASSWDQALWVTAGPREAMTPALSPTLWVEGDQVHSAAGPLLRADSLAMPGQHNRQNLLLAVAVGLRAGLAPEVMEAACRRFPGVPHRLERLRELDGITWFNDSKATNYDAAEVALKALDGPLVVLAGGQAKAGEASGWLRHLRRRAAAVVLFGDARQFFTSLLAEGGYGGVVVARETLDDAVSEARDLARRLGCRGVLLSPACASFDQYANFEARGDHFRRLVEAL